MHDMPLRQLLLLAACVGSGGAAGAIARWSVGLWALRSLGSGWPLGTLLVNLIGCFAFGLLRPSFDPGQSSALVSAALFTGFLGAFTTFSTFSIDAIALADERSSSAAIAYVAASVIGGLASAAAGLWLGQRVA